MRSTYLFLSVAAPLASAFVIPDESVLAEIVFETRPAADDQLSKADGETRLKGISPDGHRGWGRDGDWRDDDEYPRHGDWPGHGGWGRHGDWPDDDKYPEHGDWPGHGGWGRHGDWPDDDKYPEHGDWPGHGGWGRHGDWPDDDEDPEHGEWPGYDEDPHERWPGDDCPRRGGWPDDDEGPEHGRRPEHGGWPGHRDDSEDRWYPPHPRHGKCRYDRDGRSCNRHRRYPIHRPIDACPGPLCHADKTTWELIKTNEHTSRLAELIADDNDLIDILNSTTENHTFFALTNQALEEFPRGRNAPSPKFMSSLLRYHILPDRLSIQHIASHGTLATKLTERALESNLPQRIVVREHHDGVMLNRRSRVVGADMKTKNGIMHIITSPLHPPPETRTMLHQAPADFSTFTLALARTNLAHNLDPAQRQGGTTFAPTNAAFRRLGEQANRFLFSRQGERCLRALMQYHIVPNRTLYSDVLYSSDGKAHGFSGHDSGNGKGEGGCVGRVEEDYANVRLVTLLKERDLAVDVKKRFGEVDMRVNGFGRVERLDLLARDGAMHVLDQVLVPPRKIQDKEEGEDEEELMIEELVERLDGCVYEMTGEL
ncbi:hypothetical protein NUH16_004033 [Penicillium rubens]|uniref:uncharacterized protein n=1 Tax=Penicillium rubens TaxID=1108849 RepID=UPI002A598E8F|nr:uncharacterized protein N7525_010478 [Penicillium rubens]KAJ5036165.1 hypothetical protein NUH16_004033 [Penicillium rubens]KAJ5821194.1 hypothetical protein N7525_010478 [Penicillium rubens]